MFRYSILLVSFFRFAAPTVFPFVVGAPIQSFSMVQLAAATAVVVVVATAVFFVVFIASPSLW